MLGGNHRGYRDLLNNLYGISHRYKRRATATTVARRSLYLAPCTPSLACLRQFGYSSTGCSTFNFYGRCMVSRTNPNVEPPDERQAWHKRALQDRSR